jgi:hypothetical protein
MFLGVKPKYLINSTGGIYKLLFHSFPGWKTRQRPDGERQTHVTNVFQGKCLFYCIIDQKANKYWLILSLDFNNRGFLVYDRKCQFDWMDQIANNFILHSILNQGV